MSKPAVLHAIPGTF